MAGTFTISLDCELYWGVRDKRGLEACQDRLRGDREIVPRLLSLFNEFGIHATWAAVGFLFFENRDELQAGLPSILPAYENSKLNPYLALHSIGRNELEDPFHFASSLLKRIAEIPGQEIGTHTFSHYYCLEKGQTPEAFRADLVAALRISGRRGFSVRSLVFPRNQLNEEYLSICRQLGLLAYRGNPASWAYNARKGAEESFPRRAVRLLDSYFNLTGTHCRTLSEIRAENPRNVAASRFLRPYSPPLRWLDPLRLHRIRRELDVAVKEDSVYHLWWHPHNFGVDQEENLAFLRRVLEHYARLATTQGMRSLNMGELAE